MNVGTESGCGGDHDRDDRSYTAGFWAGLFVGVIVTACDLVFLYSIFN